MKILLILNDGPYGTERSYNALRLAKSLARQDVDQVTLFLMADAVACAKRGQKPPAGYYNIEVMLQSVLREKNNRLLLCGTCVDARGLRDGDLVEGAQRSDMEALAAATCDADKVLVY